MDDNTLEASLLACDWASRDRGLAPLEFKVLQGRMVKYKCNLQRFMQTLDPTVGFDYNWLLSKVGEPVFIGIRWIASRAPPTVPNDPEVDTGMSDSASQLQSVVGGGHNETPGYLPELEPLPNPHWDALLRDYCRLLEAFIEAYLVGDDPVYTVKHPNASLPDVLYRAYRDCVSMLAQFPYLQTFVHRLMKKLEGARMAPIVAEFETQNPPTHGQMLKRETDTPDLGGPAKKI
ncbi:hypothetical protein F4808DRAFT_152163 [Astrocystis sublimbata]|nr:hypothetical protein F4808DRAFT_152163 [Astrocystis sublimbata]